VGTLEPRKNQAQLLDAFELLWDRGLESGLVLVGSRGWLSDDLQARLGAHPMSGRRLHWLRQATDHELVRLYRRAAGLAALSEDEGFGLPLREAQWFGCPLIARDIPVFRETVKGDCHWVRDPGAESLAHTLSVALDENRRAGSARHGARDRRRHRGRGWKQVLEQLITKTGLSVPESGIGPGAPALSGARL
jgi:glycosyltransferase involved in cell wall biosynthesis